MIRRHDFNSAWWNGPAGIVDDPRFFELPDDEVAASLAPFDWVEYHGASVVSSSPSTPARKGFAFADAHLQFRVALHPFRDTPNPDGVSLQWASDAPFSIAANAMRPFEAERFYLLPGVDHRRTSERYAQWSVQLLAEHPGTCLRATYQGAVQGWFLGRVRDRGLELTLAMLSDAATISGATMYRLALGAYARAGFRMGSAGYSYRNTGVANIYSSLGARLTGVRETWMWQRVGIEPTGPMVPDGLHRGDSRTTQA